MIAIIWSPSTSLPFSSTASNLSASPSKAIPKSHLFSFTYFIKFSSAVEPQLSLIFIPLGLLNRMFGFKSSFLNSFSAVAEAEPFEQSIAIFRFLSICLEVDAIYSM